MKWNELADWFRARDHFCILTHRRPDGDTIGCAAALCRGLRKLGKDAVIFENEQFTPKYQPFLQGLTAPEIPEGAVIVSVDMASKGLFPLNLPQPYPEVALAIDHHSSHTPFAPLVFLQTEAACGENIWKLLDELGVEPDKDLANAIYLAVSTDTGCFRFSNTTANTLRCAAWCKEHGADCFAINRAMFMIRSPGRIVLEGRLMERMEFLKSGKIAICPIEQSLLDELGLTEDDIDDISDFPRQIRGVEVGATLRQVEGEKGKISLRTTPGVDAAAICGLLGGGGHVAAAGATVEGGIPGARRALLDAIDRYGYGTERP